MHSGTFTNLFNMEVFQTLHWEIPIPYLSTPNLVALVVAEEGLIRWEGMLGTAEAVGLRSVFLKKCFYTVCQILLCIVLSYYLLCLINVIIDK